jgi:hypothetical protein
VYQQEVQSLVEAVHGILDEYPPLEALRVWFLRRAGPGDAGDRQARRVLDLAIRGLR